MSNNLNFLSDKESKELSDISKTIKEDPYLSLGVYPMKVDAIERKNDKNEVPYLRVNIDTGYLTKEGKPRYVNQLFYLEGTYPDGREKKDDFVRFMKVCFKISSLTNATIAGIIGKPLSVATRKDPQGYIQYWYAEHIESLASSKKKYNAKNESGLVKQEAEKAQKGFVAAGEPEEPDYLKDVPILDDEPFN